MSVRDVVDAYQALPPEEKREAEAQIGRLPPPTGNMLGWVWLIVILTLATVVIGGGVLVYALIQDDKSTEVFVGFVSAALGALIGLLAPSPVSPSR